MKKLFTTLLGLSLMAQAQFPSQGLKHYFRLDNDSLTSIVKKNVRLTVPTGGVSTITTSGAYKNCFQGIGGASALINTTSSDSLLLKSNFTISFWALNTSQNTQATNTSTYPTLIELGGTLFLRVNHSGLGMGKLEFGAKNSSDVYKTEGLVAGSPIPNTSTYTSSTGAFSWTNFVITYNSVNYTVNLYINSVLSSTLSLGAPIKYDNNAFTLLTGTSGTITDVNTAKSSKSYIDEVAVFNRELSQTEITALKTNFYRGTVSGNNLKAYWPLNGNLKDSLTTSGANDLSIAGTSTTENYIAGKNQKAISLTNDAQLLRTLAGVNPTGTFTLGMWIKKNSNVTATNQINQYATYFEIGNYYCRAKNGAFSEMGYQDDRSIWTGTKTWGSGMVGYNGWDYLTVVYTRLSNASIAAVYINGTQVVAPTSTYSEYNNDANVSTNFLTTAATFLTFGGGMSGTTPVASKYAKASFDEIVWYNRALNEIEVEALYLNGGTPHSLTSLITDITEANETSTSENIEVYPNPSSNFIHFNGYGQLYDLMGNYITSGTESISVENLKNGMYTLKINNKSFKVVKN